MGKINVFIKRADSKPYSTWISDTLENLQRTVGGYIERVTLATDMAIICNEEGRLLGLPHNCRICGVDFVGDLVFVGVNHDEFTDVPISFKQFKKLFPTLWEAKE